MPQGRNSFFRELVRFIPSPVSVKDSSLKIVFVNDAFCDYWGWESCENLLGLTANEIVGRGEAAILTEADRRLLSNGHRAWEANFTLDPESEDPRTLQVSKRLFEDSATGEKYIVTVTADITARQVLADRRRHLEAEVHERTRELTQAVSRYRRQLQDRLRVEQKLARSREKYHAVFQSIPVGMYQVAPEGRLLNVNRQFALTFGYNSPAQLFEALGSDGCALFADPSDREEYRTILERFGEISDFEVRMRHRDGRLIWVGLHARAIRNEQGRCVRFDGYLQDITVRREADRAIRESEARYRAIFDSAGTAILIVDGDGVISMVNRIAESLTGIRAGNIEGSMRCRDLLAPGCREEFRRRRLRVLAPHNKNPESFDCLIRNVRGEDIQVVATISRVEGTSRCLVSLSDVTEMRRMAEALDKNRAYFTQLFANSPQAIILIDAEGHVSNVNPGFEDLFNWSFKDFELMLRNAELLPQWFIRQWREMVQVILFGESVQQETRFPHRDGRAVSVSALGFPIVHHGEVVGGFIVIADISERKAYEKRLTHMAMHDALTGQPNRALFMERLEQALLRSRRQEDESFAVLMLDLDRFKQINDTLGHLAGDQLLVSVTRRLRKALRGEDTLARLGGDEFAVILESPGCARECVAVARRIIRTLERPVSIGGKKVITGASVGLVLRTKDYTSAQDILRDADIAMYRAKSSGPGRFRVFSRAMREQAVEALTLENDLRAALRGQQFFLQFQPILSLSERKVVGFEALVRWNHPVRGLISPEEFIPIAEETGLIIPLGQWVLEKACEAMAGWAKVRNGDGTDMYLAVNLSARQTTSSGFAGHVERILKRTGLDPERLALEITETAIMDNPEGSLRLLSRLKNLGVHLCIDDFGTGYSSLSSLQRLPVDILKVDRSFVQGLCSDTSSQEIVRAVVALAHSLGLDVVAEGVEELSQVRMLQDIDCQCVQGFYYAAPMDETSVDRLVASGLMLAG